MTSNPNILHKSIVKVLDCMRDTEIDLVTFVEGLVTSNKLRIKNVAIGFLKRGGFEVVLRFMLKHLGFKGKAKHSARYLTAINKALGSEIWMVIGQILEQEINISNNEMCVPCAQTHRAHRALGRLILQNPFL